MRKFRNYIVASIALLVLWTIQANTHIVLAQQQSQTLKAVPVATLQSTKDGPAGDGTNYEVQVHLLTGLNESGGKSNLPTDFNRIVERLRTSLPYSNYRVAATFIYRLKEGHNLDVRGVAGSLFTSSTSATTPTFYELTLNNVTASESGGGGRTVQISPFKFGLRLPVITGQTAPFLSSNATANANTTFPVINYEPTGINTSISVGEAVPTLVGTITTSRADESYFLVLTIKPVPER